MTFDPMAATGGERKEGRGGAGAEGKNEGPIDYSHISQPL